jgi:hypothetical protein
MSLILSIPCKKVPLKYSKEKKMKEYLARLSNSTADDALKAAEMGELLRFLQTHTARGILWTRSGGNSLVGNPTLGKIDRIYKFHLHPVVTEKDQGIMITTETPTGAYVVWAVWFVVSSLLFCVGVILPIILIVLVNNKLEHMRADVRQAFEAWDKTKSAPNINPA